MKSLVVFSIFVVLCSSNEVNLKEFTSGNRKFTSEVYKSLVETEENFLFSPLSIESVLAVIQSGAKNKTGEEIRKTLHLPNSIEKVETVFKHLTPKLKGRRSYSLVNANKIYIQNNYSIKDEFLETAKNVYHCPMENIDFSQKDIAAKTINNWVAKRTNNKIHNIVDSSRLSDLTKAILVNTMYFRGQWWTSFDQLSTRKEKFFKTPEEAVEVDMMHNEGDYGYFESRQLNAKFLKMGFKGCKKAQMIFVLPNKKNGLQELEENIDKALVTLPFKKAHVNVVLPKFNIQTEIDFYEMLKKMGMKTALGEDADFSGIAGKKGEFQITEILQKTFIDVGEGGVEAAAAATVHFQSRSFIQHIGETKSFVANHPFLFYIKIKNVLVFAGRILVPSH